jgi:hypothetical protein
MGIVQHDKDNDDIDGTTPHPRSEMDPVLGTKG